jgi:ubiquinone/menaquinone biosynthesis C-methylase UbiE
LRLEELQRNWNEYARTDALWSILTVDEKKGNRWQVEEFFETGVLEIDAALRQISDLGVTIERYKTLDFGCGVGRLTQALAIHFAEVWGVDIAPSMIERANSYNKHGIRCRFIVNDRSDLGIFDNASFDFIYSNIVLQHMKPKYAKQYIQEFTRILKPHGVAVFQLPSERLRSMVWHKKLLRLILSASLVDCLFRFRLAVQSSLRKGPSMEMYSIPKEEVLAFLEQNGVRTISVKEDPMNHGNWKSYIYFVQKTA